MEQVGRYLILRELGRGAMGIVYEARDPLIGRVVAIKLIRLDAFGGPSGADWLQERLFREARSAGALSHPGIVTIYDVGIDAGVAYIAMERVDGPTLDRHFTSQKPGSSGECLNILRQTAVALDYAHENGVFHRDIKPGNLMLHKGTTVKITDFGIAKITDTQHQTRTGMVLGTPSFMSPEQITAAKQIDGRSDQFSLAVIAFEMLTGAKPFPADTLPALVHQIVYGERPSARALRPGLPEAIDEILTKGLAKGPEDRYPTCQSLVEALDAAFRTTASPVLVPSDVPAPSKCQVCGTTVAAGKERCDFCDALAVRETVFKEAFGIQTQTDAPLQELHPTTTTVPLTGSLETNTPSVKNLPETSLRPIELEDAPEETPRLLTPVEAEPRPKPLRRRMTPTSLLIAAAVTLALAIVGIALLRPKSAPENSKGTSVPQPSTTEKLQEKSSDTQAGLSDAGTAEPAPSSDRPVIDVFTADASTVGRGQNTKLRWSVSNASSVRIEPGIGKVGSSGDRLVTLQASGEYKLTARGQGGSAIKAISIVVTTGSPPPPAAMFTTDGESIQAGQSANLKWSIPGATEVIIEPGVGTVKAEGTRQVSPAATTTYSLIAHGSWGELTRNVAVSVSAPPPPSPPALTSADIQKAWDAKDYARIRALAAAGNPEGQFYLGLMYDNGQGLPADPLQAALWYRKAGDQGHASAQLNLGLLYQNGRGVAQDNIQAASWYRKSADQGNSTAQNNLGLMFENGRGVPKDEGLAATWYRKSAEQGNVLGQKNLGVLYENGRGIARDYAQALTWYQKAADLGNAVAQNNLGNMYFNGRGVKDDSQAAAWYKKAAEQGFVQAQNSLGFMLANGRGLAKDDGQAVDWYRKASDQNYPPAQTNLAIMYESGRGVVQDYLQAVALYRKAADQGYSGAQNNLGLMLANGRGVAKDEPQAVTWYRKAAESGNAAAQTNLGFMFESGRGVSKDENQAVGWYRKAADQGFGNAQFRLGLMYENGRGIAKDEGQAAAWYKKSADQVNANAQYRLGYLYEKGLGLNQDINQAVMLYRQAASQGLQLAIDALKRLGVTK